MGDLSKHFSSWEFSCPCCGKNEMNLDFLTRLETLRRRYGKAIKVTSGYRCEKYNKKIGGVSKSSHMFGLAADIACPTDINRYKLLKSIFIGDDNNKDILFNRIGIGSYFIHIDIDGTKNSERVWGY